MGSCPAVEVEDDEYAKLVRRMNSPRIVIDNDVCEDATVVQVDYVHKHGILLELVQVLTDLNLIIKKAYITSDGSWFMDVFNVTDSEGYKLKDEKILNSLKGSLESNACFTTTLQSSLGILPSEDFTLIELIGNDRPGLLSEVCAVLRDLNCNVVKAELWTHNTRAAAVIQVTDETTHRAIKDRNHLSRIRDLLCNVLKGDSDLSRAKTIVSVGLTHSERRLHQMMFDDWGYEEDRDAEGPNKSRTQVTVTNCTERGYTVVTLWSKDRPKLLFDTLCALTDMKYLVFHGSVDASKSEAYQEYYIRHSDGHSVSSKAEQQRIIRCLKAAIERRTSEGLELELHTDDRIGLLSDITRVFREYGLCIRRAEISTDDGKALDTFHVSETSSNFVDAKTVDSIRTQIGQTVLRVKQNPGLSSKPYEEASACRFLFGYFLKVCSFQNFRLIHPES
ncbi:ACT domain-containing protein ACR6-like [Canna indica]|uniref:ACT domain-containing protein ACR n=1 Tax=Canna indica TaxID=4628 RepID=A0AAQ3KZP0_9LILI|nr:ACT domain-containing protein ACR6-like [Canna indica]